MKKFGEIYKQKLNESETRQEGKVLNDFKVVYNAMLEHYGLKSVKDLDDDSQLSFLTEINHYWSEEAGLSEKGQSFIDKGSMSLNENSTAIQKKNYLRNKSYAVISETLRQSNIKFRLYDVIDEMYHQLNAQDVAEILTPDMITNIISESFYRSLTEFTSGIKKELTESVKPKRKYFVRVNTLDEISSNKKPAAAKPATAKPATAKPKGDATEASTETASDTATETSTKTATSTEAYTQGNITVTGGAGAGDTHVTIQGQTPKPTTKTGTSKVGTVKPKSK